MSTISDMEGIVEHFRSERNELRLKLQASEAALAEERAKAVGLTGRIEVTERLCHSCEEEATGLREDLEELKNGTKHMEAKAESGRQEVSES